MTKSIWNEYAGETNFPSLEQDISVDTAIIGGGITGISTAKQLMDQGQTVAVLEAHKVGGGTTSHSTGNLYSTVDKNLGSLSSKYDFKTVEKIVASRAETLDQIELNVQKYNIDCDFARQPFYLYSALGKNDKKIEKELSTGREIGLDFIETAGDDIPFPVSRAIKLSNQAQFNPMRYVQGLANSITSKQCQIFEHTHVDNVTRVDDHLELSTSPYTVKASNVVHATHTPKGIKFVHTLLGPYREYGVAWQLEDEVHPEGIYWGYFDEMEKFSTRVYKRNGKRYLMVIGKSHKVGHANDNAAYIKELKDFARHHFEVDKFHYKWGGQHYRPADKIPYIGQDQLDSNVYMATGFSTDGLIYGALAGNIISDKITGVDNKWKDLYKAARNQPLKAAKKFLKENADVAKELFKKLPGVVSDKNFTGIKPGEGKVVEVNGKKVAAYKDKDNELQLRSAVCTHMACIVNWNNEEETWDCPCHATRFRTDGTVLEGPAYEPLKEINKTN